MVITVIVINCCFLAAMDPLDTDPSSTRNSILDTADLVFQVLYSLEMASKCGAFGVFCGERAYVKQTWNIIDGFLVFAGWIGYLPFFSSASLNSIRVVRVLRPLRTVQSVPGLKLLVNSMLASIPQLANVLFLCAFLFVLFGITGASLQSMQCCVPSFKPCSAVSPPSSHALLCPVLCPLLCSTALRA